MVPDETQGWMIRDAKSTEPEGYYDTQQEAIEGARQLARSNGLKLYIHTPDGRIRDSESFEPGS